MLSRIPGTEGIPTANPTAAAALAAIARRGCIPPRECGTQAGVESSSAGSCNATHSSAIIKPTPARICRRQGWPSTTTSDTVALSGETGVSRGDAGVLHGAGIQSLRVSNSSSLMRHWLKSTALKKKLVGAVLFPTRHRPLRCIGPF